MTTLEDRLRAEARAIPARPPADLAARVQAIVAGPIPRPPVRPRLRPWLPLAAAAALAVAVLVAWPRSAAPPAPVAVVPAPGMPSLVDVLPAVRLRDPARSELAALEADLAAAARTVRAALPF